MAESAMNSIKRKIQALKEAGERKDDEIDDLRQKFKHASQLLEISESEVKASEKKYVLMEEKLDYTEEKLDAVRKVLDEVKRDRDDKERELNMRVNSDEATTSILEQQSSELKEAKDIAQMADYKYDEIARKLVVLTTELELAEKRAEEAEVKAEEADRMTQLSLRYAQSQKHAMERLCDVEVCSEEKIALLQGKLDQVEALYEEKVKETERLYATVGRLEGELIKKENAYLELKSELDTTLVVLNEI